jgi:hypothetical protein
MIAIASFAIAWPNVVQAGLPAGMDWPSKIEKPDVPNCACAVLELAA